MGRDVLLKFYIQQWYTLSCRLIFIAEMIQIKNRYIEETKSQQYINLGIGLPSELRIGCKWYCYEGIYWNIHS